MAEKLSRTKAQRNKYVQIREIRGENISLYRKYIGNW